MNHGSLFSGIGGFDLAAQWMGWENIFHCEINPFGRKALKYYWPESISYDDITKTDFTIHRGTIDILTGGFPCQPFSVAGKRRGTEDHRNLWPQMYRVIKEIQPVWVVAENVHGIVNWSDGMVFRQIISDLENEKYEVWPFILPACSVNAPHKRERVWFIAYHNDRNREKIKFQTRRQKYLECNGRKIIDTNAKCKRLQKPEKSEQSQQLPNAERNNLQSFFTHTISTGRTQFIIAEKSNKPGYNRRICIKKNNASDTFSLRLRGKSNGIGKTRQFNEKNQISDWRNFPTQSPVCSGNDGVPSGLVGITVPKHRNESIKAYGNVIVPQVAYQIFKAIDQMTKQQ